MSPRKPLLIYDGRCGFCKIWIDYWKRLTGDRVDYIPSQDVRDQYPQISPKAFSESVQLVRPDGSVASGARAVFESLGRQKTYESSRLVAGVTEASYRFIANHRDLAYQVTKFTFGDRIEATRFASTQWIFLRLLAVLYALAFASLAFQITGLIGLEGILPLRDFMKVVEQTLGPSRFIAMPSLFWADASDPMLAGACWAGVAFAILLFLGRLERLMLILLFIIYLSCSSAGQDFLQFQWDSLLLETGFLAIFLGRAPIVAWLFRWLVFRLALLSGAVKLLSHDPTWRNLTAVGFHYHTQPLPTILAWYADKFPAGFQHNSTFMVLAIEIGIPFLIFTPRRTRMFGAWCLIGLQVLILLTGNYGYFNWLTIILCVFLFDDQALRGFVPKRFLPADDPERPGRIPRILLGVFAAVIFLLGATRMLETFTGDAPAPLLVLVRIASPFQIVNSYGLFATMTTTRPEIIVEGSNDGDNWLPYEFKYKPGDLNRAPRWIAPFQPRLDWQMWFAALGNYRENLWFVHFVARLLDGSPEVLRLLEKNPFSDHPPRYIRALVYEYSFTSASQRKQTGAWWQRKSLGTYLPPVGMKTAEPAN